MSGRNARRARRVAIVAGAIACSTCSAGGNVGRVEADLYDVAVECDPITDACTDPQSGDVVAPTPMSSWVFTSTSSATTDEGLFVYFEMRRPDGTTARVELDVATADGTTGVVTRASYVETDDVGRALFTSGAARGRIELSADLDGADCDCTDGRFELVFVDPGADGRFRTNDDHTRRLSRARFGIEDYFCLLPRTFTTSEDDDGVRVNAVDRCPSMARTTTEPDEDPGYDVTYDSSSSCSDSSSSTESDGCGSDDGSSSSESDGCGGDDSSSDGGGCDGGGCEGDSSGGGCEGDSAGGGCEGDSAGGGCGGSSCNPKPASPGPASTALISGTPQRRRRSRWSELGRMQVGLLVGAALVYVRRQRKRDVESDADDDDQGA